MQHLKGSIYLLFGCKMANVWTMKWRDIGIFSQNHEHNDKDKIKTLDCIRITTRRGPLVIKIVFFTLLGKARQHLFVFFFFFLFLDSSSLSFSLKLIFLCTQGFCNYCRWAPFICVFFLLQTKWMNFWCLLPVINHLCKGKTLF